MPDTYTTFMQEPEPKDREQSIEAYLKSRLQSLDKAVAGYTSVSLAGLSGNVDLSPAQAKYRVINLTGAPAGAVTVRIPATTGSIADPVFVNACTGTYSSIIIKSTGANAGNSNGVTVESGTTQHVRHDGESAYPAADPTRTSGAWLPYTPTLTAFSGSLTSAAVVGRYRNQGKTIVVRIQVTITTNGSAAGNIGATLPFPAHGSYDQSLNGRETAVTGKALTGTISAGDSKVQVNFYDNTYPGASGHRLVIEGVYEAS